MLSSYLLDTTLGVLGYQLCHDGEQHIRYEAATKLGTLGDTRALKILVNRLADEPDQHVRAEVAKALGSIGNDAAFDALIGRLRVEEGGAARVGIVSALGEMGDPRAMDSLARCRQDGSSGVRAAAAGALGKIGGDEVVAILIDCLRYEPDAEVRTHATAAFTFIVQRTGCHVQALD